MRLRISSSPVTIRRRSIAGSAALSGIGLHTGKQCAVRFLPGAPGSGIKFRRTDLPGRPEIPATVDFVTDTSRHTCLADGDATVATTEHLLASVASLNIDDLVIELDGPELPIMDGSARSYFAALQQSTVIEVDGEADELELSASFTVETGSSSYKVCPSAHPKVSVTIDWDHDVIGKQSAAFSLSQETFEREIADARTFGFLAEGQELLDKGLIQGAALDNVVVLTDDGVDGTELRWPDEFVRHKMLDLLGDLCLLARRIRCSVEAYRPSHTGNIALVRSLKEF